MRLNELTYVLYLYQCLGTVVRRIGIKPIKEYIYIYIQGDSGGISNTLGNDSMCDSKQKSSHEHASDFERLPR